MHLLATRCVCFGPKDSWASSSPSIARNQL